jgi:hypothetical protein
MPDGIPDIDIEAFRALDQQRLQRVLGRAIEEEAAAWMRGQGFFDGQRRSETRLRSLCTLLGMIRDMNDRGLDGMPGLSERRKHRTL